MNAAIPTGRELDRRGDLQVQVNPSTSRQTTRRKTSANQRLKKEKASNSGRLQCGGAARMKRRGMLIGRISGNIDNGNREWQRLQQRQGLGQQRMAQRHLIEQYALGLAVACKQCVNDIRGLLDGRLLALLLYRVLTRPGRMHHLVHEAQRGRKHQCQQQPAHA